MPSPLVEKAIEDALSTGRAIVKYVSANDAGATGGHQSGFYLPKSAWHLFSPHPPEAGRNDKSKVRVLWQQQVETESVVTWYGQAKSEYRLTRFGKGFQFLHEDMVGSLLVLITRSQTNFDAYVFDGDDADALLAALGLDVIDGWAVLDHDQPTPPESEDGCIQRRFREFADLCDEFPSTADFSRATQTALEECIARFGSRSGDKRLLDLMKQEFQLFQRVERQLCASLIGRLYRNIDEFLEAANTITQRRKSRAGHSFENHIEYLLRAANIPFEAQVKEIPGKPDIIIPGTREYLDPEYPTDKLFMLAAKRTCKDRWRQILPEAPRLSRRYLVTIQDGISSHQLEEIRAHNVVLVVPEGLHSDYPKNGRSELLTVDGFLATVRARLGR